MVVYEDKNVVIFDWKTFAVDECHHIVDGEDIEQYVMFTNLEKSAGIYIMRMQDYMKKFPERKAIVKNMPLSWIPLMHFLNIEVDLDTVDQSNYVLGGKLSPRQLLEWAQQCAKEGTLRDLIEIMSSSDEQMADTLYQLDHLRKIDLEFPKKLTKIHQNNWQSYGRSYIQDMHKKIVETPLKKEKILFLPCTKSRPYYSKQALYKAQKAGEFADLMGDKSFTRVVVSNIGVIPEEFWGEKPVMTYSAGVPDIWLIYRMMKEFLGNNKDTVKEIVSYVEFPPYIEIIEILAEKYNIPLKVNVKKKYKQKGQKFALNGV